MTDVMTENIRRMIFISLQHLVHIDRVTLVDRFLKDQIWFYIFKKSYVENLMYKINPFLVRLLNRLTVCLGTWSYSRFYIPWFDNGTTVSFTDSVPREFLTEVAYVYCARRWMQNRTGIREDFTFIIDTILLSGFHYWWISCWRCSVRMHVKPNLLHVQSKKQTK